MKIKLIIIAIVSLIVAGVAGAGYYFDYAIMPFKLGRIDFRASLISLTMAAIAASLLILIFKCLAEPHKKERLLRLGLAGLSIFVVLFLNSIEISIGRLIKLSEWLKGTSNCISNAQHMTANNSFIICSGNLRLVEVVLPLVFGIILAFLIGFAVNYIKSRWLKGIPGSRIAFLLESFIWVTILEVYIYTTIYDVALIFISALSYSMSTYFLVSTDFFDDEKEAATKEINPSDRLSEDNDDSDEFEQVNTTPPRF
ncbi:MAG: hypothetical protein JJV97_02050 [SAR324 cluster bacterium]|nr:hypothetical protein [SAR324 cluster bacterium]